MKEDSRLEDGIYKGYKVSIRLVREGTSHYNPRKVTGPADVYEFFRDLENLDREVFYSLHLDMKNQIIGCEEVSRGSLCYSLVSPREVYKAAILSSAANLIVAHNHPSGDPMPSKEDYEITERLTSAGEILGISLIDSIVIGDGRYFSLKEKV